MLCNCLFSRDTQYSSCVCTAKTRQSSTSFARSPNQMPSIQSPSIKSFACELGLKEFCYLFSMTLFWALVNKQMSFPNSAALRLAALCSVAAASRPHAVRPFCRLCLPSGAVNVTAAAAGPRGSTTSYITPVGHQYPLSLHETSLREPDTLSPAPRITSLAPPFKVFPCHWLCVFVCACLCLLFHPILLARW